MYEVPLTIVWIYPVCERPSVRLIAVTVQGKWLGATNHTRSFAIVEGTSYSVTWQRRELNKRSSAQGNCSAKSILYVVYFGCFCCSRGRQSCGGGGIHRGTFTGGTTWGHLVQPACTTLPQGACPESDFAQSDPHSRTQRNRLSSPGSASSLW